MTLADLLNDAKQVAGVLNSPNKAALAGGALAGAASVQFQTLEAKWQDYFGYAKKVLGPLYPGGIGSIAESLKPPAPSASSAPSLSTMALLAGGFILLIMVIKKWA